MSEKFPNPKTQLWFSSNTSLPSHQSPIHQKLVITFLAIYIEIPWQLTEVGFQIIKKKISYGFSIKIQTKKNP